MIWLHQFFTSIFTESNRNVVLEDAGIDPATSRMQSARSAIWGNRLFAGSRFWVSRRFFSFFLRKRCFIRNHYKKNMIWPRQFSHSFFTESNRNIILEDAGIDPANSRMQSARFTISDNPPPAKSCFGRCNSFGFWISKIRKMFNLLLISEKLDHNFCLRLPLWNGSYRRSGEYGHRPATSRMLSARSTIWAHPPLANSCFGRGNSFGFWISKIRKMFNLLLISEKSCS